MRSSLFFSSLTFFFSASRALFFDQKTDKMHHKERERERSTQTARKTKTLLNSSSETKNNDDDNDALFVREQSSDARVDEFYQSVFLEERKLREMSSFWSVSAEPPPEIRRSGAVVCERRRRRTTRRIVNVDGPSFGWRYQRRRRRRGRRGRVGGRLRHGRRRRGSLWRR